MSEKSELANQLVEELSNLTTLDTNEALLERLKIILADFIICVASGNKLSSTPSLLAQDGAIGLAARLASQSAYEDKDDLDWSAVNHPGSVVFAAALATTLQFPKFRKNFLQSALAGMRTSASIAHFFGAEHRKRWHITATAGTFGATSAAAAVFNLNQEGTKRAFHLAGTNMGGIGQVSRELQRTPRFNRAAAAALGVTAAAGAYENIPSIKNLWDGDRGLIEVFNLETLITGNKLIKDGLSTVRVRTFPATGFIQSALLGVSKLAELNSGELLKLKVEVNAGVFPILSDPAKERWWNLQLNCAAAWRSKNPMDLTPAPEIEKLVLVQGSDIPLGSARISGETSAGPFELYVAQAPGLDLFDQTEILWRNEKWRAMIGESYQSVVDLAAALISGDTSEATWDELEKLVR